MLQKLPHSIPATRCARVRSLARTTRARAIHTHISARAPHTRVFRPFAIAVARTLSARARRLSPRERARAMK
jgi:hypothetical protein